MKNVPPVLHSWFVINFFVEMCFAIPLMIAPQFVLELFGWVEINPIMLRVVAAALLGIVVASWLGRNASAESFRGMLNLNLIQFGAVIVVLLWWHWGRRVR